MKCTHCRREIESDWDAVLVSIDGDFVHKSCKDAYEADRDRFFREIVSDPDKCQAWLMGADV